MGNWSLAQDSLVQFYRDERGQDLIEWVVLTVLVAVASFAVLRSIQAELGRVFVKILSQLLEP
jgi:Flp pilus assembly pilin Flp